MDATEVLLNQEQIDCILLAAQDPVLRNPYIIQVNTMWTSVVRVSARCELIFIRGNEFTGSEHITVRHSYHSLRRTWQTQTNPDGSQKKILDDPSRFRPGMVPLWDYPVIADSVYEQQQRDDAGNKRPELFDKYVGDFVYGDGVSEKHVLLLYKGTRIVHTLFPSRSTHNRPKTRGLHLKRAPVSAKWDLAAAVVEVSIPYLDESGVVKYTVTLRASGGDKTLEIGIYAHRFGTERSDYMQLQTTEFNNDIADLYNNSHSYIQYADLRWIEKFIKDTESGTIPLGPA